MRKPSTYFEQIPVQKVREIVMTPDSPTFASLLATRVPLTALPCSICSKPVTVETAKTDCYGKAVHEECYLVSLTQKPAVARTKRIRLSN